MGRETDPFDRRGHSQDRRKRESADKHDRYEENLDFNDEYEVKDTEDFDERGLNIPRIRSAPSLPPFPSSTRNKYPRTSRVSRMPESTTPRTRIRPPQTTRPKQYDYLPDESQPYSRRTTGSPLHQPRQRTHTRSTLPASTRRVPSRPHKRRVWPIFLGGCAAGAVSLVLALAIIVWIGIQSVQKGGLGPSDNKPITGKSETQTIALTTLSQLIVCDMAGNISLNVDPNATSAIITTTKTVRNATGQSDADQKLSQISVSVQAQPSSQPLTCDTLQTSNTSTTNTTPAATPTATDNTVLSVNVVFPTYQADQTPTVQAGQSATADITIVLPKSVVQSQPDPSSTLISLPYAQGNITVDGLSGKMDIRASSGDITVTSCKLVDGSKLQAQEGKVSFDGSIWSTVTPQNKTGHASLSFSGAYLVDLTLPETSSVMLDATAYKHTAKISSELPIQTGTNNGSPTYFGPFNPAIQTNETTAPRLTLQSSSGNIALHKGKVSQSTP